MRIGLIARTEDRGLGNLTWEWSQHMRPDRVLIVIPNHPIEQRVTRYADRDATILHWNHHGDSTLDESAVREFLHGLDVVYSAETFYDWRICDWAREQGVRTVCHVMPEFYRHGDVDAPPRPDVWWTPTSWRRSTLDPQTRLVPVPIATERFANRESFLSIPDSGIRYPTWLHVAGAKAAADRNGTRAFLTALRFLRGAHRVRIRTQQRLPPPNVGRNVDVEVVTTPTREYWELYAGEDALVLPRRYAGISLPAMEAMAAGLALVMTNVEPQASEWPIVPIGAAMQGEVRTAAGRIPLATVTPRVIAAVMDRMAANPGELLDAQARASLHADLLSWRVLEPRIRAELVRACE